MYVRFLEAAAARPSDTAVSSERSAATFAELAHDIAAAARHLTGTSHRPVVLAALPSGPEFTALQLATFAAGGVFAPIPPKVTHHEAKAYLRLITPDVVAVESSAASAGLLDALREPATVVALDNPAPENDHHRWHGWRDWLDLESAQPVATRAAAWPAATCMIQFTSGSGGQPKGVCLSEDAWRANIDSDATHQRQFSGRDVFCPVPQFHAMGNAVVLEHLCRQTTVHVTNHFVPGEDLRRMRAHNCVALVSSPSYVKLLLKLGVLKPAALPELRAVTLGSATIDQAFVDELRSVFPALTIHCRYGLSEAVGTLARWTIPPGTRLEHPGLTGRLVGGAGLAAELPPPGQGEPGEVRVRTPTAGIAQLTGHEQWTTLTGDSGTLHTGDLACADADGCLHLRGRRSSFLKHNGFRLNPFEIEEVVRAYPGVMEALVVGLPDPIAEQIPVACIEPTPGREAPSKIELAKWCQARLATHKVPQQFMVFESLPRTHTGKPDRPAIAARLRN